MLSIQEEMLRKAAHNLERVEAYFKARTKWRVGPDTTAGVCALHLTLVTAAKVALKPLLHDNGIAIPTTSDKQVTDQLPASELDSDRLRKFLGFTEQLSDWFVAQAGNTVSPGGRELLLRIFQSVESTALAMEEILRTNKLEFTPLRPPPPPPPPREPDVEELADGSEEASLVLDDTEETPVLQTFKGKLELSWEAKQAIGGFLEEAGLKYGSYQLDKFERKVQQWVEATPQDHLLEIKISTLHGRREPYPSYQKKQRELT